MGGREELHCYARTHGHTPLPRILCLHAEQKQLRQNCKVTSSSPVLIESGHCPFKRFLVPFPQFPPKSVNFTVHKYRYILRIHSATESNYLEYICSQPQIITHPHSFNGCKDSLSEYLSAGAVLMLFDLCSCI